jgi:4-aminobutyrate aminotransferase-like enzyme
LLRRFESPNVTFIDPDGTWPIVWARAKGTRVWDADGRAYLDFTAGFGVANAGHANAAVVRAAQEQLACLPHALGDVHPHRLKAELARALSCLTFERWRGRPGPASGKTIFGNSGFEAVEAALKTAMLATGKAGVVVFTGAYHGLGYGALNATHRAYFRVPFRRQLAAFGHFVPFPAGPIAGAGRARNGSAAHQPTLAQVESAVRGVVRRHRVGAVLVEPVQGRGGIRVPPDGFLPLLRRLCDELGMLLIVDEIFTGFGRTGRWFACEHSGTVPDLICLGKALTGGFPLSACVGRADLMDAAWPVSQGEAMHTSTFLGHPVGCAMALAQISEIKRRRLVERSARLGNRFLPRLASLGPGPSLSAQPRGLGLMAGIELRRHDGAPATETALRVIKELLRRGFLLLPEGEASQVISLTPPLTISETDLDRGMSALADVWRKVARP